MVGVQTKQEPAHSKMTWFHRDYINLYTGLYTSPETDKEPKTKVFGSTETTLICTPACTPVQKRTKNQRQDLYTGLNVVHVASDAGGRVRVRGARRVRRWRKHALPEHNSPPPDVWDVWFYFTLGTYT
jgi:hypothetical protein